MMLATHVAGRLDLLPELWHLPVVGAVSALEIHKTPDACNRLEIIRALAHEIGLELPTT